MKVPCKIVNDEVKTFVPSRSARQRPEPLYRLALLSLIGSFLSTTNAFLVLKLSAPQRTSQLFEAVNNNEHNITSKVMSNELTRTKRIRSLVKDMAKRIVPSPFISSAYAQPEAIAEVLKEAAFLAVDEALLHRGSSATRPKNVGARNGNVRSAVTNTTLLSNDLDIDALIAEAFAPMEQSLDNLEESLHQARTSMAAAKLQAQEAVRAVQAAAVEQVQGAVTATHLAQEAASRKAVAEMYAAAHDVDVESLAFEDIDFAASQMTPPFLGDDQCLVPGEPVVRVEKAPQNSRRIFAGIDIMASVDTVWDVLTDYANLQNVVPNLAVNTVVEMFEGKNVSDMSIDDSRPELEQCRELSTQLKGAVLKQVGKVRFLGPAECYSCFALLLFFLQSS
jgi:hypothetical protein